MNKIVLLASVVAIASPAVAQITVTTERVTTNPSATGTFVFNTIPSNTSLDAANGRRFSILAGTPNAGGPISNLTNGLAQTNHDSVAQSFFAIGNAPNGTEKIRVQMDLEIPHSIDQINTYSWHQTARASQTYRVYGANSPTNNAPDFTAAAFQGNAALAALGYTLIANVATVNASGGQFGAKVAGAIGTYRYILFDMAPMNPSNPRPTFFGEIDIIGKPEFALAITPTTLPATSYDLTWKSRRAKLYHVRTSTDMSTPISQWDLVAGNIATTHPQNFYQAPASGPRRFYAVEETPVPPFYVVDFEQNNGGFTVVTEVGSSWEYGAPTSGTPEVPNPGGYVNSGNAGSAKCWGTVIGNPGFYTEPTTTRLRSSVIDLTNVLAADLTFAQALDMPSDIPVTATAVVNIISATSDTIIASAIHASSDVGRTSNADWSVVSPIMLDAWIGQQVRIEWVFTATTGADFMGWYIDDVKVTEIPK